MSAEWLLRALAVGALLTGAGLAAERVGGWTGRPQRWGWAAAMAGTLLLPMLALAAPGLLPELGLFPAEPAPSAQPRIYFAPAPSSAVETASAASTPVADVLPAILALGWVMASLAMVGALGWTWARLGALAARCTAARVDGTRVLVAERAGPAVVGLFPPEIVVPRWLLDAPAEERRLVVRHEREHVSGGDAWLLAAATLAVAAMPWNPVLWWQHRRLRLVVETDCDARVLAWTRDARAYGLALLRTARAPSFLSPLTLAWGERTTDLERRILAMTAQRPSHPLLRSLPLLAGALAAALAACEAADPRGERPSAPAPARQVVQLDTVVGVARDDGGPRGALGMDWNYRIEKPVHLAGWRPGDPPPPLGVYPAVSRVDAGSPAAAAGLAVGDTIVSSNGRDTKLGGIFPDRTPGAEYVLRVRRGGVERGVRLTVGEDERLRTGTR
jgi:beta-lactamase regulating signal transducer with metallopeptidase domain